MKAVSEALERVRELRYLHAVWTHLAEHLSNFLPSDAGNPKHAITVTDGPLEPVPTQFVEDIQESLLTEASDTEQKIKQILALPIEGRHEKKQTEKEKKRQGPTVPVQDHSCPATDGQGKKAADCLSRYEGAPPRKQRKKKS